MLFSKAKGPSPSTEGSIYGVSAVLEAYDSAALAAIVKMLPPQWEEDRVAGPTSKISLTKAGEGAQAINLNGDLVLKTTSSQALRDFDWVFRHHVAEGASDYLFLHAGVAAFRNRAIVIPGSSFSGKTTLTKALVELGATYYSDEYAVIDGEGLIHPYAKTIDERLTSPNHKQRLSHGEAIPGSEAGTKAIPAAMILFTQYIPDAAWDPRQLDPADALLQLLPHTFGLRSNPAKTLNVLRKMSQDALSLTGDRGDGWATSMRVQQILQDHLPGPACPEAAPGWRAWAEL